MNQTAIDYLYQQFLRLLIEYGEDKIDYEQFGQLMTLAKDAAKNIEQAQIEQSYNNGLMELTPIHHKDGQDYYNEKYKQ
jgi:hypothetical protein